MDGPPEERLPLFPLGTVLFPGMLLPLHVFEERYRQLMRDRAGVDPIFGVVLTRHGREVGDQPEIHDVGTAASLVGAGRYPDGRYDLVVRGGRRFRVAAGDWDRGYLTTTITWLEEDPGLPPDDLAPLADRVARTYEHFLAAFQQATGLDVAREDLDTTPPALAYAVCARLPLDTWERQRLLEDTSTTDRLTRLLAVLRRERDLLLETGAGGATVTRPGARFSAN